jgi:hypothetical protein
MNELLDNLEELLIIYIITIFSAESESPLINRDDAKTLLVHIGLRLNNADKYAEMIKQMDQETEQNEETK